MMIVVDHRSSRSPQAVHLQRTWHVLRIDSGSDLRRHQQHQIRDRSRCLRLCIRGLLHLG